jgi:hypothetical protein
MPGSMRRSPPWCRKQSRRSMLGSFTQKRYCGNSGHLSHHPIHRMATMLMTVPTTVVRIMSQHPEYRKNPGWQAWKMSSRISYGNHCAREGRVLVATLESSEGCSPATLTRARQLLTELEAAADRGNAIWRRIKEVTAEMDPTLFDPSDQGITVIRNHGPNPMLIARIRTIWGEYDKPPRVHQLFEQLTDLCSVKVRSDRPDNNVPWSSRDS